MMPPVSRLSNLRQQPAPSQDSNPGVPVPNLRRQATEAPENETAAKRTRFLVRDN